MFECVLARLGKRLLSPTVQFQLTFFPCGLITGQRRSSYLEWYNVIFIFWVCEWNPQVELTIQWKPLYKVVLLVILSVSVFFFFSFRFSARGYLGKWDPALSGWMKDFNLFVCFNTNYRATKHRVVVFSQLKISTWVQFATLSHTLTVFLLVKSQVNGRLAVYCLRLQTLPSKASCFPAVFEGRWKEPPKHWLKIIKTRVKTVSRRNVRLQAKWTQCCIQPNKTTVFINCCLPFPVKCSIVIVITLIPSNRAKMSFALLAWCPNHQLRLARSLRTCNFPGVGNYLMCVQVYPLV